MKNAKKFKKKRHLAAVAIIFDNNGRVLLIKRNEPRATHAHNKWSFPGVGIEFGEHPSETVIREIKEEIGLDIKLLSEEPFVISELFVKEIIHVILLGYPSIYVSGKIDVSRDRETKDAQWFDVGKIDYSICMPQVKQMIEKVKKYL